MTADTSTGIHRLAIATACVGVLLVWWGAAVTTKDVGLAVPDWPLSYRKINPQGWWRVMALMLEHGHRWLATIVGSLVLRFSHGSGFAAAGTFRSGLNGALSYSR